MTRLAGVNKAEIPDRTPGSNLKGRDGVQAFRKRCVRDSYYAARQAFECSHVPRCVFTYCKLDHSSYFSTTYPGVRSGISAKKKLFLNARSVSPVQVVIVDKA